MLTRMARSRSDGAYMEDVLGRDAPGPDRDAGRCLTSNGKAVGGIWECGARVPSKRKNVTGVDAMKAGW